MANRSKKGPVPSSTAKTRSVTRTSDQYLELVRECPLRVIRSDREYDHAIATINRLSDRGKRRTPDETEYFLALALFVEKYEEKHHSIAPASGAEMLEYFIETHVLTQSDVAAGTGLAESTISEIPAGKRKLSVKHIDALARFFKVKAAVFLDE
jgi:HTH-type transcriptional regulator / antitoxin HigA